MPGTLSAVDTDVRPLVCMGYGRETARERVGEWEGGSKGEGGGGGEERGSSVCLQCGDSETEMNVHVHTMFHDCMYACILLHACVSLYVYMCI